MQEDSSRLKLFTGIFVFGLILFVGGLIAVSVIQYFENRVESNMSDFLSEVVTIDAYNSENDGKLIHITGAVKNHSPIMDDELDIRFDGFRAVRKVEIYQYYEEVTTRTERRGANREVVEVNDYSYSANWSTSIMDSNGFNDKSKKNPTEIPFENEIEFLSDHVTLDEFTLDKKVLQSSKSTELNREVAEEDQRRVAGMTISKDDEAYYKFTESDLPFIVEKTGRNAVSISEDGKYLVIGSFRPESPSVGNVRISYAVFDEGDYTVIGKQNENTIDEYISESGKSRSYMQAGIGAPKDLLERDLEGYSILFYMLRGMFIFPIIIGGIIVLIKLKKTFF